MSYLQAASIITTLLQWIGIGNKHLYNGQKIDPEHWVHLNVRSKLIMKFSIVAVQEVKYIVIKQVTYLEYFTTFCFNVNTFLLMPMPLQVSPCSDPTFIPESFEYYYQILTQMPFCYYFAF